MSAPTTVLGRPRRHRSDDPLEVGVPTRIAMDRDMLRHIKLQPLDVLDVVDLFGQPDVDLGLAEAHLPRIVRRVSGWLTVAFGGPSCVGANLS
jgi:hypothetical protein